MCVCISVCMPHVFRVHGGHKKGRESQIPKRCDVGSPSVYILLLLIKE